MWGAPRGLRSASDLGAARLRAVWVSRELPSGTDRAATFNPLPLGAAAMPRGPDPSPPAPAQVGRTSSDSRLLVWSGGGPGAVAAASESEPAPTPTTLSDNSRKWRNWLPVGGLAVEAAQLAAVAFQAAWQANGLGMAWVRRQLPQLLLFARRRVGEPPTEWDDALAVMAMVAVLGYALLVGYFAARALTPSHPLGPLVYEFLPGDLYLTVSTRLLHCVVAHSGLALLLQGRPRAEAEAFAKEHGSAAMVALALTCLALYTSSAIFLSTYRKDTQKAAVDVVTLPVFRVLERSLKSLLSFSTVLCLGAPTVQLVAATAVTLALFLAVARLRPMLPQTISVARLCTLGGCLWTVCLALASVSAPRVDVPWLAAVAAGWGVAALALAALALSALRPRVERYTSPAGQL